MFFAKKTSCLVASIVTLRIRVETDPGHKVKRLFKPLKNFQMSLDFLTFAKYVLGTLEPCGSIKKRKSGREKLLHLGPLDR